MTTTVTMLQTRQGEGGSLWTVGNSYAASDAFATVLINSNYATGTLPKSRGLVPVNAQTDSNGQITALVDGAGNNFVANLAISQLPNNTLSDTVTTQQQLAVATIPGGLFKADSILEVNMLGVATGAVSKTVGFKAGAASGTLASATAFGGTGGITNQGSVGIKALLWGNGVLGAQRATANGPINWAAAHASTLVTLGIDTSLDWNIYVYVQFATSGSGDTFMVRPFWATWCR